MSPKTKCQGCPTRVTVSAPGPDYECHAQDRRETEFGESLVVTTSKTFLVVGTMAMIRYYKQNKKY